MNSLELMTESLRIGLMAFVLMAVVTAVATLLRTAFDRSTAWLGVIVTVVFAMVLIRNGWAYFFYEAPNFATYGEPNEAQLLALLKASFVGGVAGIVVGLVGGAWFGGRRY